MNGAQAPGSPGLPCWPKNQGCHGATVEVQGHADLTQYRAEEPGTIMRLAPRGEVVGIGNELRQGTGKSADALLCQHRRQGIAVAGVKRLDGMGDCVERAGQVTGTGSPATSSGS